ncbi:MAG: sulfotransferase [Cycloclasticus sp.]
MADKKVFYTNIEINTAYKQLCNAKELSENGQKATAENAYKQLLLQFPKYYAAHRGVAGLYIEQKRFYLAFEHLSIALGGDNLDYYSMVNLEALAFELGMFETGRKLSVDIEAVGSKLGLKKHSDVHYFNKGNLLYKTDSYQEAIVEFKKCLKSKPDNAQSALKLIECYKRIGEYQQGLQLIEKFLSKKHKKTNEFIYMLSDFPAQLILKNIRRYVAIAEKTVPANEEERIAKLLSLARYYHANKDFKKSWDSLSGANNIVKGQIKEQYANDSQWEKDLLSWAKNTKFKKPLADSNLKTLPLFILGPSRSGKSSLETALGWLPGLKEGLESKLLSESTSHAFNVGNRLPSGYLPFLPDDLMPEFTNFYRSAFKEEAQNSSIFTTTTPGLVASVPTIIHALPNAKFIFLIRDYQDIALRMYFTHYNNSNHHSYDFKWSLNYIKWYYELVDTWKKKFPSSVMTINYESLIADPAEQIKTILDFLDIKEAVPESITLPNDCGFSTPYEALINNIK